MSKPLTRSMASRLAEIEEGREFARKWRARRYPIPATDPYPFRGHRNCAEWSEPDQ